MMNARIRRLLLSRWLVVLLVIPLVLVLVRTTSQYRVIETSPIDYKGGSLMVAVDGVSSPRFLNDFEDFYVVGRLFREGEINRSYDNGYLTASQQRFTGTTTFMPWAYPPPLTALTPILPLVGLSGSYLLFMAATLALYLWTVSRFGARYLGASLLAVYPALLLVMRIGQNGFLTGALIGLFLLGMLSDKRSAGVSLGLMTIKPHLAVALGLLALLQRRWEILIIAVAVVLAGCTLATLVLGLGVWAAFFSGVLDAGGYLREGLFPLYRMSSVYACLRSFGLSPDAAMAVHACAAVAALGLVAFAWWRGLARNRLLALACLATLFVSPYNYDYDLACLAAAVALLMPELLDRASTAQMVMFYGLAWVGTGAGLAQHLNGVLIAGTIEHPQGTPLNWSFQALGLIATAGLVAFILRRPPIATRNPETSMAMSL